jgi:hypothetical protein
LQGNLIPPNTPIRGWSIILGKKDIVVWFDVEQLSLGRNPTKLVFTTPSQYEGMQQIEKRGKEIHLPIVSRSWRVNIPLMKGTRKLQIVWHGSFLKMCNIEQVQKSYLDSWGLDPRTTHHARV